MKTIIQDVFFQRDDLGIHETIFGTDFSLKGCSIDGKPGAPAFPVKSIKFALPLKTKPGKIKGKIVKKTLVSQERISASCIQNPIMLLPYDNNSENSTSRKQVMPDADLYKKSINDPIVVMGTPFLIGNIPIVDVLVKPLRYSSDGTVEFIEHVVIEITLEEDLTSYIKPPITRVQRYKEHSLVHELVINPDLVKNLPLEQKDTNISYEIQKPANIDITTMPQLPIPNDYRPFPLPFPLPPKPIIIPKNVDYLIITDNNKWNKAPVEKSGTAGDLVSEFMRLADHKKKRGYRVHVARIEDIVNGGYGNFATGVRDLQEIIRNFLKYFVQKYGVEWLLLGGDVSIIPPRLACACAWGIINKGTINEVPELGCSEWKNTFLGMRINMSDGSELGLSSHFLTNYNTGELIPYKTNNNSNNNTLGWYHTTDGTFTTRSTTRTEWIRVNGPSQKINASMAWYAPNNMIPTDLYYSSLYSHLYNIPGKHDWDLLDTGLYGQHNESNISLGGIDFSVDVHVGRAPVETAEEARIFVDKVIEYDSWGETQPMPTFNRFKKMLYVAEHMERHYHTINPQQGNTMPPSFAHFSVNNNMGYALISAPGNAGNKIICHYNDVSRKQLVYNSKANAQTPGWYYAISQNNLSPSVKKLNIFSFFTVDIPIKTEWIVVWGPPEDISPMCYTTDEDGLDRSIAQQEELRKWMLSYFPRVNQVQRLYTDETDLTANAWAEAGIKHLTAGNLEQELNNGPNFVSLSGHGGWRGVSHLRHDLINRLSNSNKTFIAFVDSCSTCEFDQNDAIGESLLLHPNGGAVAYIGYSRGGWCGVGAAFIMKFFQAMKYSRHLGSLNDSRCNLKNNVVDRLMNIWTILIQNLMGDPEMNVYRDDKDAHPRFVGNKKTKELHRSTCQWVERYMANWNMRYFDTIEEGLNIGYDGCYYCLKEHDHG